jgi:rubrerythrin
MGNNPTGLEYILRYAAYTLVGRRRGNGYNTCLLHDKRMLPTDIKSPGELLSTALAIERVAIGHYTDMAARMGNYGNHESVELFERLVCEGLEHENQLAEWAELEGIELTELSEAIAWEDPLMPTTYDAEARDPYRSTPYKALAYAAHNTDRAFHLYTHIQAITADPQTERYAEILANDALNRSRLLQSRRRRAYHNERRGPWQQQLDVALDLKTVTQLYAVSVSIQARLTELLTAMGEHYEDVLPIAEQSRRSMEYCKQQLTDTTKPIANPPTPYDLDKTGQNLHEDILLVFTESERAFNFYDAVLTHAYDEEIMLAAQDLSAAAIQRMEEIREVQRNHGIQPAA